MKNIKKLCLLLFITLLLTSNVSIGIIYGKSITISNNKKDDYSKHQKDEYDLLIITPYEFSEHVKPLIEHKNKYGIKTKEATVENIYNQIFLRGKDKAEKIKYFIKDAKENWDIKYVLFIGGRKDQSKTETWWIPVRYTNIIRDYKGHEIFPEGDFLSDLYFADIYDKNGNFSSWDDDNDGIFGEWKKNKSAEDIPDLYPDVYVGRLPCRNKLDVKVVVKKIIDYETNDFDDSWFKKLLVIAGDTYPEKTDYIDGENYTQQAIDIMTDFEPVKIWSTLENLNWLNIVKEFNRGCGFVFFSGHGGANLWGTHPPNDIDTWIGHFKLRHMIFLFNKNKLPVVLSASGCFNNMFNVSLKNSFLVYYNLFGLLPMQGYVPRCWGWNLVRNPYGGSIATIASTGYSYESSDVDTKRGGCEWLDIHFFEEYQKSNSKILGECWGNTITHFLDNFTINWSDNSPYGDALIAKNVEQWLLIGDPSLKIGGYN